MIIGHRRVMQGCALFSGASFGEVMQGILLTIHPLIIANDLPGNITGRRTSDSKTPGKAAKPSPGRSGMPTPRGLFIGVLGMGPEQEVGN